MVKVIDSESFSLRINSGLSQIYKIEKIIEIKTKEGRILNMCKIELDSKADYDKMFTPSKYVISKQMCQMS